MVLGDVANGLTELVSGFPVSFPKNITDMILLMKAFGIVAIVYIIYTIAMGVFTYSRMKNVALIEKRVAVIEKKVNSIDEKLNKILRKK